MDTSLLQQMDDFGTEDFSMYTPPTQEQMTGDSLSRFPSNNSSISAGTALQVGGDILGGIGGYMQGQEEAGADEYNASLALMEGQFQVQQIGLEEGQALSTQKAVYAKAGVEQSGSVLDTALNTATQFEYSKQVATFNAQSDANMEDYEAKMAKQKGEFSLASGLISGAGSLLGL